MLDVRQFGCSIGEHLTHLNSEHPDILTAETSHAYSMAWIGAAQRSDVRSGHADPDLRQVHRRAVRARLRLDDRQRPAPRAAFQPGRQRGHADQSPQCPARIHHDQGRVRRRHRHRAQRQIAGREEPQRNDARAARREEHGRPDPGRRHRNRRSGRSAQSQTTSWPRSPTTCRS